MSDTQSQENIINSTSTISSTSASPGELLSRQREQLGVPLADAARALNLRPAVVAGLEQDDYQEIPVAAYRRGYLRAYAKYLGMDERLVLEAYQARNGTTDTERKVTPVSTASRPPSRIGAWLFKLVTLLVIAGLIVVTVMWWQSRGGNEPPGFGSTSTEETATAPAESTSEPLEAEQESPTADSSFTSGDESAALSSDATNVTPPPTDSQEPAPSVEDDTETDTVAALDPPTLDSDDQAAEENETETSSTADTSDEQSNADTEQTADAEQTVNNNVLELTFNEQSWTEIFDATNQRVFVGLQTPGTTTTVEGEPPFRLTVGNATGVELRYQGEEVDLPAQAGANNVARFTLGE
ncbi:MAG TPA: RodZ domain-containing protein [Halomonas sp.]|nr:RodZ domain-containing protein [Halomonas sp.]